MELLTVKQIIIVSNLENVEKTALILRRERSKSLLGSAVSPYLTVLVYNRSYIKSFLIFA